MGAGTTRTGQLRLTVPVMDWDAYVHLAFDEIRLAGARSPQVSRRLIAALEDLLEVAPPERRTLSSSNWNCSTMTFREHSAASRT